MAANEETRLQMERMKRAMDQLERTNAIIAARLQDAEESAKEFKRQADESAKQADESDKQAAESAKQAAEAAKQAAEETKRADAAAKQAAEEAKRADAAAKQAAEEAKRADAAEQLLKPTDYLSYLSLCHHKLFLSLRVQPESKLTSAGGAANVKNKRYPLYLKKWDGFPTLHGECQRRLEATFGAEKIFQPAHGVDMVLNLFADGPVADEEDMKQFQCFAIEAAVRFIANEFLSRAQPLSDSPTRQAKIRFLNNPYGLLALDLNDDSVTDDTPAYVPTMTAALKQDMEGRGRTTGDGPPPSKRRSSPRPRVYPDQWCFKVDEDGVHVPTFVIEYKAAHKLPAMVIEEALLDRKTREKRRKEEDEEGDDEGNNDDSKEGEQDREKKEESVDNYDTDRLFIDVIRALHDDKIPTDTDTNYLISIKRITAQVITQAFHYMVEFGLCYAYIASGEALLLLNLRPDDPRTLYYHLALPGRDVSTDVTNLDGAGNLHNTAIAQVLSLVLMGSETPVLTQRWKQKAYDVLKVWPDPYPEMKTAAKSDTDTNAAAKKPDLPAPAPQDDCGDPAKTQRRRKDDDDDDDDYRPPPPPPRSSAASTKALALQRDRRASANYGPGSGTSSTTTSSQQRPFDPFCRPRPKDALPYCTQACLLGVRRGGLLDRRCPNVRLHERPETPGRHPLTADQLVKCVRAQLAEDLDDDCEGLDKYGKYGATSMLFRVVLRPYGYSFVAKGVQRPHAWLLEHERDVYESRPVAAQQGQLVPVCLGLLELVCEYISYTGAHVSHMLLLSYGGEPMWKLQGSSLAGADEAHVNELIQQAWFRLSQLGVEHGDEREPNVVWNEERQAFMCIDFGMAEIRRQRERSPDMLHGDALQSKRQRTEL